MRILYLDSPMLVEGFKALGHEVISAGFHAGNDIMVKQTCDVLSVYNEVCAKGFVPECVFWCDSSNLPYFMGVENLPCPTAFYSIDTYCHHWHFGFSNAFDAVFVAQKDHLPLFPVDEIPVLWLPLFARESCQRLEKAERDIPISFVGTRKHANNPDRELFLREFRRLQPLMVYTGAYSEIFSRSQIVLNQTACHEVNFRCFEAMATGAALLMEYCRHGLEDLFTPGENILPLYPRNNHVAAAAVAGDALRKPEKLAAIAHSGKELVHKNHMAKHRAATIVSVLENLIRENAVRRRFVRMGQRRMLIGAAYAMLGLELEGRLDSSYVEYYYTAVSSIRQRAESDVG